MNIKKIGLTALAGSLAMVSAQAVELAVTGKTEITYMQKDNASTGNPFGNGNMISFAGSGDVNGMTATYEANMQDGGQGNTNTSEVFASSGLTLDMGDFGKIGIDNGVGAFGAGTIDDKMPYAYEEVWTYVGSEKSTGAAIGGANQNVVGYSIDYMGASLSVEIDPGQKTAAGATGDGGSTGIDTSKGGYNWALTGSPMDGLSVGMGLGEESIYDVTSAASLTYGTVFATYAMGGITMGYQMSEARGGSTGNVATDSEFYGISYSVNENFAVSYNEVNSDFYSTGAVEESTNGLGASYTMGSAAVRLLSAKIDNKGGVVGAIDETITELSLMLAF